VVVVVLVVVVVEVVWVVATAVVGVLALGSTGMASMPKMGRECTLMTLAGGSSRPVPVHVCACQWVGGLSAIACITK